MHTIYYMCDVSKLPSPRFLAYIVEIEEEKVNEDQIIFFGKANPQNTRGPRGPAQPWRPRRPRPEAAAGEQPCDPEQTDGAWKTLPVWLRRALCVSPLVIEFHRII